MSALNTQVGGDHYKNCGYQPIEFIMTMGFDFIQGNIIKYATRYMNKNGIEDLKKALHYCQLGKELRGRFYILSQPKYDPIEAQMFVEANKTIYNNRFIEAVALRFYDDVEEALKSIIKSEYGVKV